MLTSQICLDPKVIIFDFDGTIADTFDTVVTIGNNLAIEYGYRKFEFEDIVKFRNFTSREVVQKSGVSLFHLPFLLKQVKKRLNTKIACLMPIAGMKEVLLELNRQGHKLGIITSNSPENVNLFLENNGLKSAFAFTISGTTLFGKHRIINSCLKQHHFDPAQVIYVGDETRDIEAARKSKIKSLSVSWGFNFREVLSKHKPDFLIDRPSQLLEAIDKWGLESRTITTKTLTSEILSQKRPITVVSLHK
jgi:phosphoglycolate phosphatase